MPILCLLARAARAGIGSYLTSASILLDHVVANTLGLTMIPSGKLGAEPAIMIVFEFLDRFSLSMSQVLECVLHGSRHPRHIGLSRLLLDRYRMNLDAKVLGSFPERRVSRGWYDP